MTEVTVKHETDEAGTITGLIALTAEGKEVLYCPWDESDEHNETNLQHLTDFFKKYLTKFDYEVK
jgi:hypothetical protein